MKFRAVSFVSFSGLVGADDGHSKDCGEGVVSVGDEEPLLPALDMQPAVTVENPVPNARRAERRVNLIPLFFTSPINALSKYEEFCDDLGHGGDLWIAVYINHTSGSRGTSARYHHKQIVHRLRVAAKRANRDGFDRITEGVVERAVSDFERGE